MNRVLGRVLCFSLLAAVSATTVTPAPAAERPARKPAAATGVAPPARVGTDEAPSGQLAPVQVAQASSTARPPGMILTVDPVTGDLVPPTAAQTQYLDEGLEALFGVPGPPVEVTLPDGSRGSYVARRLATALFASVGPSGQVTWGCSPGSGAARWIGPLSFRRLPGRLAPRGTLPPAVPVIAPEE